MIPIARPLASGAVENAIAALLDNHLHRKAAATGIKGCLKQILGGSRGLLVLTTDTTPMDLITHLPVVCEDRGVEYIFVSSKSRLGGFTCVFLELSDSAVQEILKQ